MPTVKLPLPDSRLSGHANGNNKWKIISLTKKAREAAHIAGLAARGRKPMFAKARVSYKFFVPDNRQRDTENMRHACKAMIDGLKDAQIMAGDHWQVLESGPATVSIDRDDPRVEITIEEIK